MYCSSKDSYKGSSHLNITSVEVGWGWSCVEFWLGFCQFSCSYIYGLVLSILTLVIYLYLSVNCSIIQYYQFYYHYIVKTTILSITSCSLNILFNPRQILCNPGIHPWVERVCTTIAPGHHTYQWVGTTSLHCYQGTCAGCFSIYLS